MTWSEWVLKIGIKTSQTGLQVHLRLVIIQHIFIVFCVGLKGVFTVLWTCLWKTSSFFNSTFFLSLLSLGLNPLLYFLFSDSFRHLHQPSPSATVSTPAAPPTPSWLRRPSWGAYPRGCCCGWGSPGSYVSDYPNCMCAAIPPATKFHQPTAAAPYGDDWPQGVHLHDATVQWVHLFESKDFLGLTLNFQRRLKRWVDATWSLTK